MDFDCIFKRSSALEGRRPSVSPHALSKTGQAAHRVIHEILTHSDKYRRTGDAVSFYSPEQWREDGNELSTKAVLVVVYNVGTESDALLSKSLVESLKQKGLNFKPTPHSYAGIIPNIRAIEVLSDKQGRGPSHRNMALDIVIEAMDATGAEGSPSESEGVWLKTAASILDSMEMPVRKSALVWNEVLRISREE